jgi:hypothetical protein
MLVIVATQEAEIKRISLKPAQENSLKDPISKKKKKKNHKKGLVEWLK